MGVSKAPVTTAQTLQVEEDTVGEDDVPGELRTGRVIRGGHNAQIKRADEGRSKRSGNVDEKQNGTPILVSISTYRAFTNRSSGDKAN